ncbi:MAG: transposase [Chloroflexi bacterium]|nr:MAG: transposase [Chloroflexota bacterium]
MLRQRQGYRLRGWLEEVEQHGEPELQAFARNLHKEESAVQAGLTLAWSNGPTEGFLHRLTLLCAASVWPGRRRLAHTADALPSL